MKRHIEDLTVWKVGHLSTCISVQLEVDVALPVEHFPETHGATNRYFVTSIPVKNGEFLDPVVIHVRSCDPLPTTRLHEDKDQSQPTGYHLTISVRLFSIPVNSNIDLLGNPRLVDGVVNIQGSTLTRTRTLLATHQWISTSVSSTRTPPVSNWMTEVQAVSGVEEKLQTTFRQLDAVSCRIRVFNTNDWHSRTHSADLSIVSLQKQVTGAKEEE